MTMPTSDDMPIMDDLPEMGVSGGPAPPSGNIPGLSNLLMERNSQGGMWSPVQKLMGGSTKAEEYLALTSVAEEDIPLHMQILYLTNLYSYGNGNLSECIWAGYQLRRAVGGKFSGQIVEMVTGQKAAEVSNQEKRQAFLNKMRGGTDQGNTVGKLMG